MWICTILICTITPLIFCLFQGISFYLVQDNIIPKFEQSIVRIMSIFIGGWWPFVSYKGARYNDVNEVMHIRKWRVTGGCCFTRCLVSPVEAGRRPWFVSCRPTMIRRAGNRVWVGIGQTWLAARLSATHCMADLDLPFPFCLLCPAFVQPPKPYITSPKRTFLGFFLSKGMLHFFVYAPSKKVKKMILFNVQQ